ncbi:MAG TPA: hypothetical protein VGF84_00175 [Micromonosporaceae bacterium]
MSDSRIIDLDTEDMIVPPGADRRRWRAVAMLVVAVAVAMPAARPIREPAITTPAITVDGGSLRSGGIRYHVQVHDRQTVLRAYRRTAADPAGIGIWSTRLDLRADGTYLALRPGALIVERRDDGLDAPTRVAPFDRHDRERGRAYPNNVGRRLEAVDPDTGVRLWSIHVAGGCQVTVLAADRLVELCVNDALLRLVEPRSGVVVTARPVSLGPAGAANPGGWSTPVAVTAVGAEIVVAHADLATPVLDAYDPGDLHELWSGRPLLAAVGAVG